MTGLQKLIAYTVYRGVFIYSPHGQSVYAYLKYDLTGLDEPLDRYQLEKLIWTLSKLDP